MYSLQVAKRVIKEMQPYPPKIFKQVASRIFALSINPRPHDSKKVGEGHRVDVGEYRIFYVVDDPGRTVNVLLVGKRNDEAIYKQARRLGLM